jgi:superfamily II DNA or RNA helicase
MNSIQKKCSAYIDCYTNKSDRNKIIKKYKNGDLPFLINVRILVEGFDAPITKGICFMHMPSNKTILKTNFLMM